MEGSGSRYGTSNYGSGFERPKNIRIRSYGSGTQKSDESWFTEDPILRQAGERKQECR
jgi:hypothetical protein